MQVPSMASKVDLAHMGIVAPSMVSPRIRMRYGNLEASNVTIRQSQCGGLDE
jgi:hypothetical protein